MPKGWKLAAGGRQLISATGRRNGSGCRAAARGRTGGPPGAWVAHYNAAMPIGTAVHERTFALCESLNYREWSGYYAVSAYESHHEHEYNAIRNASALIDVSPLFKYLVTGPDASRLVDRLITRDVAKMAVGQVYYTP